MDTWEALTIIGIISFSIQGSLIAMEKKLDIFAVYTLGLLTAFGGGILQNALIGGIDYKVWNQEWLFYIAVISITVAIIFPKSVIKGEMWWSKILDAFGTIAFAIQGGINAIKFGLPTSAIVVSALITATGGGIIRDLLSQRKSILLRENIYMFWIFLIGIIMGFKGQDIIAYKYLLFIVFSTLRILSFVYGWRVPYRDY